MRIKLIPLKFVFIIIILTVQIYAELSAMKSNYGCDDFYKCVLNYTMSKTQMMRSGIPMPGMKVKPSREIRNSSFRNTFKCLRCCNELKNFRFNMDGNFNRRWWRSRVKGSRYYGNFWNIPKSDIRSCYQNCHRISEVRRQFKESGYKNTSSKLYRNWETTLPEEVYRVYAVDCEMCVTAMGMELTRVSVVDDNLNVVYDTLVRPQTRVTDDCKRISGIRLHDLEKCKTTLHDVQRTLLSMVNEKTILIGHDIGNDLRALKLYHKTVVDTSLVFPHSCNDPGRKYSLEALAKTYLNKVIRRNGAKYHDSTEDARICMELIKLKCQF
ncbi:putative exonuclease GOR [Lycorma delicatula]|uniref:putative exonuclease GOR n=1 Tax=Lycorma delicatula TaxID=130591 RepID=UPI003F516DA4